ncbi:uncharacterized protein TM35_000551300 [Trypanosoma theileri]|uniref:Mucin TcMUCII n=1 Tax=Trypanosoma theileri TaxID=67003 RepID=A0A1X0NGZ7_9TRYP|nr:uncharacterized protein TM35_000551300 [Trypanosoma theileri]ORC83861.1 hypothetical protein TM35_000551300 [Trypanosoma theileri]
MNRVLFFLHLVLSIVCVGAVAGVEPSESAVEEQDPRERALGQPAALGEGHGRALGASGEALARGAAEAKPGLEAPKGHDNGHVVSVPGGGSLLPEKEQKGQNVDLQGPKVEMEQEMNEKKRTTRPQEVTVEADSDHKEAQRPGNHAQLSDSELTSPPTVTSEDVPPAPRPVDQASGGGTLSRQSTSGGGHAQDNSEQIDNVHVRGTQISNGGQNEGNRDKSQSPSSNQPGTGDSETQDNHSQQVQTPTTQDSQPQGGTGESNNSETPNSETNNTPSNDEESTTTTTTTTTLPPEPTNNKKGDADSSSISSVWVRVPLLIVAMLFSATVY